MGAWWSLGAHRMMGTFIRSREGWVVMLVRIIAVINWCFLPWFSCWNFIDFFFKFALSVRIKTWWILTPSTLSSTKTRLEYLGSTTTLVPHIICSSILHSNEIGYQRDLISQTRLGLPKGLRSLRTDRRWSLALNLDWPYHLGPWSEKD